MITCQVIDEYPVRHYREPMEIMTVKENIPGEIDRDAVEILIGAGFVWDWAALAFRRDTSMIDYKFLRLQKLVAGSRLSAQDRIGQLQRLRILIQGID